MRTYDYTSLREALGDSGHFEDYLNLVGALKSNHPPSTFVNSDRFIRKRLNDIVGISTKVGKPDILVRNENQS